MSDELAQQQRKLRLKKTLKKLSGMISILRSNAIDFKCENDLGSRLNIDNMRVLKD